MAVWTFDPLYVGSGLFFPGNFQQLYEGNLSIHTATTLRFRLDAQNYATFSGTGITYDNASNPTEVTGGRITGMRYKGLGLDDAWVITNLNLSAVTFFDKVQAQDPTAFKAFLLSGADEVRGSSQNDIIWGYARGDTLFGRAGDDDLQGMAGNDTLIGGAGTDTLAGGAGADVFRFVAALNGSSNMDWIPDFNGTLDSIELDEDVFAGIGAVGALGGARFRAGAAALDASDRVIYQQSSGMIWFDPDGTGAAAQVAIAEVANGTVMNAGDFRVIG